MQPKGLTFILLAACLGLTGCGGGGGQSGPSTPVTPVVITPVVVVKPPVVVPPPIVTPPVLPPPVPPTPILSLAALNRSGPIVIMPLGDSITYGLTDPSGDGYRKPLWDDLAKAGFTLAYCGSVNNGSADLPDTRNEGHPGYYINSIAAGVDGWLKDTQPAVILLIAGTNDVMQNQDLPNAPSRLSALIEQIRRDDPTAQVLVASLPPIALSADLEAKVEAYNAQIPGLVAAKAARGEPVVFVDVRAALTTADLWDGEHPNPGGYAKIGDAWFQALQGL